MIRVLVADDHTVVRAGLVRLLAEHPGIDVVGEAEDGLQAVEMAQKTRPDVVVVDVSMPHLNGIEVTRRIKEHLPRAKVLALTVHDEQEYVLYMVRAGASGYLVKDSAAEDLIEAVVALHQGEDFFGPQASHALAEQLRNPELKREDPYENLTPREREVFHQVIEGRTTKEVAVALGISAKTADNHRSRMMQKLQVRNTAELVAFAARRGLL